MKKILLLTTIFSLFILSSCNKDPYIYDSDITSDTSKTNIPESNTTPDISTSNETPQSSGGISVDGEAPDDGEVWTKVA